MKTFLLSLKATKRNNFTILSNITDVTIVYVEKGIDTLIF